MKKIKCRNNYGSLVKINQNKFVFRPSVYGVITNSKHELLLLRNKSNGKYWFPGGGIEIGERIIEGLKREVLEETGLKITVGELLLARENFFYYEPLDEAYHAFLFFYKCEPLSRKIISDKLVNDLESKKPRWYKIKKLKKGEFSDLNEEIYNLIQRF
jgi:ADP-ribose pyrophosphatase YjhB (NUDIX family)